jgi:hypothetical protein
MQSTAYELNFKICFNNIVPSTLGNSKCYFYYHFTTKIFNASLIYLPIFVTTISLSALRVEIMFGKLGIIFRRLYITVSKNSSQNLARLLFNFLLSVFASVY